MLVTACLTVRLPSAAVLVTNKVSCSLTIWPVIVGRTGHGGPRAKTVKLLVALRCRALIAAGLESVTTVTKRLVLGFWAGEGAQMITPLALTAALVGARSSW